MTATLDGRRRSQLVVVQGTPFCNLDCSYCYLQDRSSTSRMSEETLDRVFSEAMRAAAGRKVTFLWHAGEPLVLGVEWYERAWALAADAASATGGSFDFAFQTNGVLVDDRWVEYFKAHDVTVGLSIDGPARLHDAQRTRRTGAGTHASVMRAVEMLVDANLPFGVICVLTDLSLDAPEEMFEFFAQGCFSSVGFNIEETEGANSGMSASEPTRRRYKRFIKRFAELRAASTRNIEVRELDRIARLIFHGHPDHDVGNTTTTPGDILTFLHDGAYATFCPELAGSASDRFPRLVMGNIHASSLDSLFEDPTFREISDEIDEGLDRCRATCDYWSVCGGAFPSNKFWETGRFDVTETDFCRLHVQTLTDAVLDLIEGGVIAPDGHPPADGTA